MNEDIKKRLASLEVNNFFDAQYIRDMNTLLQQNEKLHKELEDLRLRHHSTESAQAKPEAEQKGGFHP